MNQHCNSLSLCIATKVYNQVISKALQASFSLSYRRISTSSSNRNSTKNDSNTALNYLETWVGGTNNNNNKQLISSSIQTEQSLEKIELQPHQKSDIKLVKNEECFMYKSSNNILPSSYSIPTFKLYRNDPIITAVLSSEKNPTFRNASNEINEMKSVVLDLSDFNPNGSPHHYDNPLQDNHNFIPDFIQFLKSRCSIHVIGITLDSVYIPGISGIATNLSLSFFRRKTIQTSSSLDKEQHVQNKANVVKFNDTSSSNETIETNHDLNNDKYSNDSSSTPLTSKIVHGPIRSGQQIYIQNSNVVLLGSVHSGGEILSDGDLHVYGKLNGRAFAGLSSSSSNDDTAANNGKIFATKFNPELICIGSTFTTMDDVDNIDVVSDLLGGPAMAFIDDSTGRLKFENIAI